MDREEMIRVLEELIRDEETNPTAKCTAIRTLIQIGEPEAGDLLDEELDRMLESQRRGN